MSSIKNLPPTLSWFAAQVASGQKEIFTEKLLVTPDMARRFLENNPHNRPLDARYVEFLAREITTDQFDGLNGATMVISNEGTLNDGQHRAAAIALADKAVWCQICWGPPAESRLTIDAGRKRTMSSLLSMQNVTYASLASVTARNLFGFRKRLAIAQFKQAISNSSVNKEYHAHRAAIDEAVNRFQKEHFTRSLRLTPATAAAYVVISNSAAATGDREGFFHKFCVGAHLDPDSPILHLRGRLMTQAEYNERRSESRFELILRYWNAFASKAPHNHIRLQGKFPDVLT
jgi:hypothetical protein